METLSQLWVLAGYVLASGLAFTLASVARFSRWGPLGDLAPFVAASAVSLAIFSALPLGTVGTAYGLIGIVIAILTYRFALREKEVADLSAGIVIALCVPFMWGGIAAFFALFESNDAFREWWAAS